MPLYEYRCTAGHQYEKREGFDAPSQQACERCGKPARRMIFAPPVVFKGSGFYKTDSRGSVPSDGVAAGSSDVDSTSKASKTASTTDHGHPHGSGGHSHGESGTSDASGRVESAAAS